MTVFGLVPSPAETMTAVVDFGYLRYLTEIRRQTAEQYWIRLLDSQSEAMQTLRNTKPGTILCVELHHRGRGYRLDGCVMGIMHPSQEEWHEEYLVLDYCTPMQPWDWREHERYEPDPAPSVVMDSPTEGRFIGQVIDLSYGGVAFKTHRSLERGQLIHGTIQSEPAIEFSGEIVYLFHAETERRNDWYTRVGVRFQQVTREALHTILEAERGKEI